MQTKTTLPITGIDTHAHIFCRGLPLAEVRRYAPDYDATVDDYLACLKRANLSHGVLVQPSFLGTNNDFMLDALRRHPNQLRGIAVVDPTVEDAELDAMDAAGVVGIRLNLMGLPLQNYGDEPWADLWRRLSKRNWLVEIHRHAKDLPLILPQLLSSGMRIVVDHYGRPDPLAGVDDPGFHALLSLASSGQIWVKLSAAYRNESSLAQATAMSQMLVEAFGTAHLLWGSDWPHTQFEDKAKHADERALLDQLLPDPLMRRSVLVDTPATVFRFP